MAPKAMSMCPSRPDLDLVGVLVEVPLPAEVQKEVQEDVQKVPREVITVAEI